MNKFNERAEALKTHSIDTAQIQRNVTNHAMSDLENVPGATGRYESGLKMTFGETLKVLGGELWDAAAPMANHGRTELAAAILGDHDGHVLYMHNDKAVDEPMHGHDHGKEDRDREMER